MIKSVKAQISIAGTVFVALALIVIFGLIIGISFNELKEGLGNLPLGVAGIALIVLIIIAVIVAFFKD